MVIGGIRCRTCSTRIDLVAFDFFVFRDVPSVRCGRCTRRTSLPFITTALIRFAGMCAGLTAGRVTFEAMENAFGRPIGLVPFVLVLLGALGLWVVTELSLSAMLYRRR